MKSSFVSRIMVCALAGALGVTFIGCGDDESFVTRSSTLPTKVADKAELETYECSDDIIGEKVYVTELEEKYECDGEKWFKSDDQTKPSSSSTKSLSSSSKGSSQINPDDLKRSDFLNPEISYGEITDKRDGEVYKTVKIGDQTWIAENLRYRYKEKTSSLDSSSFCYEDNPENCKKFGRMYLWSAVMDSAGIFSDNGKGCGNGANCTPSYPVQGICPDGFHVPNGIEYKKLLYYAGAYYQSAIDGYVLEDAKAFYSTVGSNGKKSTGTDDYGFSAIMSTHDNHYKTLFSVFWNSVTRKGYGGTFILAPEYAGVYYNSNGDLEGARKNYLRCIKTEKDSTYAIFADMTNSLNRAIACKTDNVDTCKYGTLVDSRDGQKYKTVQVGYMIWMAENLNYRYLQPSATDDSTSSCYDNDPENCKRDGRLYSYSAAIDSAGLFSDNGKGCGNEVKSCAHPDTGFIRGICPEGWHLPTTQELQDISYSAYKNRDITSETEFNAGGAFTLGLNIRPVGIKNGMWEEGFGAFMWTSSSVNEKHATYMQTQDGLFDHDWEYKGKGIHMSVRCVRHFDSYEPTEQDTKISFLSFDETIPTIGPCSSDECTDSLVDERDGNVYRIIKIGDQWWMRGNLQLQDTTDTLYNSYSKEYPWNVAMDSAGIYSTDGKGCGDGELCSASGKVRGICPKGWHLPTIQDFWTLMAHSSDKPLKWKNDINDLGFFHTPTQYKSSKAQTSCYWASTEKSEKTASHMCVNADDGSLYANNVFTSGGAKKEKSPHAVRCIKD